jgi:hypothetical protein
MLKATWSFLKRVAESRVGHLLLVVNMCILVHSYAESSDSQHIHGAECITVAAARQITANAVCFTTMPWWMFLMMLWGLLDLPSMLLSYPFTQAFENLFPHICDSTAIFINSLIFLVISSGQWLLIGYGIGSLSKNFRKST